MYRKSSIKPPPPQGGGGLFNFRPQEGELNRGGGGGVNGAFMVVYLQVFS